MIDDEELFIGQVTHINAASPLGARYDESQTDAERRCFNNLILLCYPHHVRVDRLANYFPAQALKEMKKRHESASRDDYYPPENAISLLARRLDSYWTRLEFISSRRLNRLEVCVNIDTVSSPSDLCDAVLAALVELRKVVPGYIDLEKAGDYVIYINNHLQDAMIKFRQIELMLLHSLRTAGDDTNDLEEKIAKREHDLRRIVETEVVHD